MFHCSQRTIYPQRPRVGGNERIEFPAIMFYGDSSVRPSTELNDDVIIIISRNKTMVSVKYEPPHVKTNNVVFNRPDTKRAVQPQKTARSLKFRI